MAFGFFRRHQKMVIVLMAVLMVAFLVSMQGFNFLFARRGGKEVLGTIRDGAKIRVRDVQQASVDCEVLMTHLGLAYLTVRGGPAGRQLVPRDELFLAMSLGAREREAAWSYALLLAEAQARGVRVSDTDVEAYLHQLGAPPGSEAHESLLGDLGERYAMGRTHFQALLERWLMIRKAFRACRVSAPPSVPYVERLFRDLNEKIALRVVRVTAEDFVADMPEPTAPRIREFFEGFRDRLPGTYPDAKAFGFGYHQPARVAIQYLQIDKDAIARTVRVDRAEARKHYRKHKDKFVKKVPIRPEEKPRKTPEGRDAPEPTEPQYKTVPMTLAEAMPQILDYLTSTAAQRRADRLVGELQERASQAKADGDVYQQVVEDLTLREPAQRALQAKLDRVSFRNTPLREAMEVLASSAALETICYPWGRPVSKDKVLAEDAKVSLRASGITLAQALERIGKSLKVGPIQWAACKGFDGVLFPLAVEGGNVSLFPVSAGATGLVDQKILGAHPVLGRACASPSGRGQTVVSVAFTAKEIRKEGARSPLVAVGQPGSDMYLLDDEGKVAGRLLWRLAKADAAHAPAQLSPTIRRKIVRDVKIQQAFESRALPLATEIESAARKKGLAAAAKKAKLESKETRLFSRKREVSGLGFVRADVPWMELPRMSAQQRAQILEYIQERVFALVPLRVEPPYPTEPRALATVPVPALQAVFVVERIDYRPPLRQEYETRGRAELAGKLRGVESAEGARDWFRYEDIVRRTGYRQAKPS